MLKKFIRILGGDPNKRTIDRLSTTIEEINALEASYESLSDEALAGKTQELRRTIQERIRDFEDAKERFQAEQEVLNEILPEAFATVREASKRTIGLRHYDVQLIGGITLHQGKIAEMRTGEGKTLVATLPVYLNALTGRGVHLITVNDYLARRDARWMAPIYNLLGLSVGVLQIAARTENGKKAFLVDLERESPHEDQHQLRMVPRGEAYAADITYGTNSEFGFDYLRDNMTMRLEERVQRGHYYAIVDEVDNVLIDEARTPLIISGPAQDEAEWYIRMAQVVRQLRPEDFEIDEKNRGISLTELGEAHVEELLEIPLRDPERPEDVTLEQARLLGYLEQALRAQYLYHKNKEYLVQAGKVIIVDEFTGRMMPGRRWSDGLHQAVEAKEGVRVQSESVTYATVTIQNYFRMYQKLSGMTGTAITESEEFDKIYKLEVLAIPTNLEYAANRPESGLEQLEEKDDQGYKYTFYAHKDDSEKFPVYWKRKDYPDVVYRSQEAKLRAIAREILRYHAQGRPTLVGTTSVELSERVSSRLRSESLRRLAQVILLRDGWMRHNDYQEDGRQIPELKILNQPIDQLDISAMRKLARELGMPFSPEESANVQRLAELLEIPQAPERLTSSLQAGIPHQVLNARKHTEESQVIAGAGAFGAVTIATNMAGRGVDIKLGGEMAEEILISVNRVLGRNGYDNPYDMSFQERRQALQNLPPEDYSIYGSEIQYFLKYMDEMEQVRQLGGLHVIGSERHEARRIDNQLRGRAARQGDPGSSRFYLSMEDELMRLFGGQQADSVMQRMKIDDDFPIELGLVSRLVESSQTRVEGANFDVRKHLLEYDDVLNSQRSAIYGQRDRIFVKDDLTEDVIEMLGIEVNRRVPADLEDEGGPWKLLAWLESVQPTLSLGGMYFPSFTLQLLLDHLKVRLPKNPSAAEVKTALLEIAQGALEAEKVHLLQSVQRILEQAESRLETQIDERLETVDTFFEGLELGDEDEAAPRRPAQLLNDLSGAARMPIRLNQDQQRALIENPRSIRKVVQEQVQAEINRQAVKRLLGAVSRRLEGDLDLDAGQFDAEDWDNLSRQIIENVETALNRRAERFLGSDGQIARDLDSALSRVSIPAKYEILLHLLLIMPQGARTSFDKRTHRRVTQRTTRLTYTYYAAGFLQDQEAEDITERVLQHLEGAEQTIRFSWGVVEFARLGTTRLAELDEPVRRGILRALDLPEGQVPMSQTLVSFPQEQRNIIAGELGRRALTEIYRQILLGVITELWVDYLTQMEALRVSIGLEAYAQRDPLVQYKSRASELFQNLLQDVRTGVVTRMFTYQPRSLERVQAGVSHNEETAELPEPVIDEDTETAKPEPAAAIENAANQRPNQSQPSGSKKRNRRRRK